MGPGRGGGLGGLTGRGEGGNLEPQQEVLDEGLQLDALVEQRGRRRLAGKGLALRARL